MAQLITKRYATALFDIANEKGAMKEFQDQALAIYNLLTEEKDYLTILSHPSVLVEEKIAMVEQAFAGQVADEFVGLLVLVIRKNRQEFILDILSTFIDMAKTQAGYLKATVTSAVALKEEQLAQLKANIEKNTGKQIELESIVDTALIGGMIVRVGDKVVDGSIRGQMDAMKSELNSLRLA
ncbi:MAG: ATP synthase F1 subunit delta [Cellulosilyticaceae bacterium]